MTRAFLHKLDLWVVHSVKSAGDNQETLLRKKIWWGLTLCWLFFFSYDFFISLKGRHSEMAFINAAGFFVCVSSLISFYFHRRNTEIYGLILQLLIVVLTSLKIFFLNGIFNATGIVFAGMIGPIYALTFPGKRRALLIFLLYLSFILGSTVYRQWLIHPEILRDTSFQYSLYRFSGGISVIFFISMIYSAQLAKLKRIEEERLIQLHHAKSKLYANITHEFRTPLTVIQGMADSIENDPDTMLSKGIGLIKSNSVKLLKLVNQLLTMSKLEADSMPVQCIQSDIIPYVRYLLESFHSIAEEKNIRLHFFSAMDGLNMDYDPEIIEELVSNLVSNAIKFTPAGGDVYLQLDLKSDKQGEDREALIFHVRDNGKGIDEDKLPFIFNRFYQVDDESTRKAEGTGIGLALVKEYLDLIQGRIQVKSRIGEGTEFIITLPVSRESEIQQIDYEIQKRTSVSITESSLEKNLENGFEPVSSSDELPILLIVEDNSDVIEYLKTILSDGYQIEVALDGRQGIALALQIIPDIIICDVMMPEKDGYDVCKNLKKNFRTNHVPFIMLTAKADMDSKIAGLEFGADAYITKPFDKRELLVRIDKLIETRKRLKEKYSDLLTASSGDNKPVGLDELFMHQLIGKLGENFHDENYGIDQLCKDTGISRTQLHRKLTVLTGKTTSDFIRHFKIGKAKELLSETDSTVSEIAYHVGFKDPNYFTKSFVKETGITPSVYRTEKGPMKQ